MFLHRRLSKAKILAMRSVLLFLLLCLCSCEKEKSCETCLPSHQPEITGLVYYAGPIAGDGCEWCIRIDNVTYSPDNLDDAFKQTDLPVVLKFELTGTTFGCGFGNSQLPVIHITQIRKV